MILPKVLSNPDFPNESFFHSESDLAGCERIAALTSLSRLDEKIIYFRQWNCPLTVLERSYLFSILLRNELKVFHKHVYGLLQRHCEAVAQNKRGEASNSAQTTVTQNEVNSIWSEDFGECALAEMNRLMEKCISVVKSSEVTLEVENAITALGILFELGETIRSWYPKEKLVDFFLTILLIQKEMLNSTLQSYNSELPESATPSTDSNNSGEQLEKSTIVGKQSTHESDKMVDESTAMIGNDLENVSSVLHNRQYPLILASCKSLNLVISKLSPSGISEDMLSRCVNLLVDHIILNPLVAAEAKRLGASAVMHISFQAGALSSENAQTFMHRLLHQALEGTDLKVEDSRSSFGENHYVSLVQSASAHAFYMLLHNSQTIGYICLIRSILLCAPVNVMVKVEDEYSILIDGCLPRVVDLGTTPSEGKEQLYAIYAVEQSIDHISTYMKSEQMIDSCFEEKVVNILRKTLEVVWNNWENPVTNISDKVREVFKKVLEVHELLSENTKALLSLDELCRFLLQTDWSRKGKYLCLNMLLPVIGAERLLSLSPHLFQGVLNVMDTVTIRTPAGQFYVDVACNLRSSFDKHCRSIKMKEEQLASALHGELMSWRQQCVDPMLKALSTASKKVRDGIIIYPAQRLFKAYPEIVPYILSELGKHLHSSDESLSNKSLKSFTHILMLAKRSSLLKQSVIEEYYDHLAEGFVHANEDVRTHSIEAITACTKLSQPPTKKELDMAQTFLQSNLNNCPPEYRTRLVDIYKKFFSRIRDSSKNIFAKFAKAKEEDCLRSSREPTSKYVQGLKQPYVDMMHFLAQTLQCLGEALYPGCPHEKVQIAISIYQQVTHCFKDSTKQLFVFTEHPTFPDQPFPSVPLYGNNLCNSFLNSFFDCWDRIRNLIYDILLDFPAPLPGYESTENINFMLLNAKKLLERPRLRESDSGALVLRLIFNKYVKELGWRFDWKEENMSIQRDQSLSRNEAILHFFQELKQNAEWRLQKIRSNFFALSTTHPVVGVLCALRYVFEDISYSEQEPLLNDWKQCMQEISQLTHDIPEIALQLLADAKSTSSNGNEDADVNEDEMEMDQVGSSGTEFQVDCRGHVYFGKDSKYSRVEVHSLVVNAWLSLRENAMLMGSISQKATLLPLPDGGLSPLSLGDEKLFKDMGELFMHILQNTKHNGVIGKSYIGFSMLCSRLLNSNVPSLAALPGKWIDALIERISQNETSILRRSGGFPFIFSAILKAEASQSPVLIKKVMKTLLSMARNSTVSTRVNSLNTLRFLFHDAELGTSTFPYAKESFIIALEGFSSEHWTIRNSSLMLYSALLQRTIGVIKVRDHVQASQNCITSREFFSKYPELKEYLLDQLAVATAQDSARLHPNLYPILLLLSRLSASSSDDPSDPFSADQFIPHVKRCAMSCNFMARSMASRALVPLIPSKNTFDFVQELLHEMSGSNSTNHIHGLLLQIKNFLRVSSFDTSQLQIILAALNNLPHLFSFNSPMMLKAVCSIIHVIQKKDPASYVRNLQGQTRITSFLSKGEFLFFEKHAHMLGLDVALGTLTKIHLKHLFYSGEIARLEEQLILALDHWCTNVVIEALKTLETLPLQTSAVTFSTLFYDSLFKLLGKETVDAEQLKYALKTLKSLCFADSGALTRMGDKGKMWDEMYHLHTSYTSCHIRGKSLELLGVLLGLEKANTSSEHYQQFAPLISTCCMADQPKEVRMSCQNAIVDSGVLAFSIDAWRCILLLAQDDNEEIRLQTTLNLSPFVFGKKKSGQVEYTIDQAYRRMTELFGESHLQEYVDMLWADILPSVGAEFPFENITLDLFDKEVDNLFEEMKFRLDIAKRELMSFPASVLHQKGEHMLAELDRLINTYSQVVEKRSVNIVSIGGASFHRDVFEPFFRILTAASLALPSLPQEKKDKIRCLFSNDAFIHPMIEAFL